MPDTTNLLQPETSDQQHMTINSFLSQSYDAARKQIGNGVSLIQESVSYIKDELVNMYDKTGACLTNMALPVNNFLKDISQIENDFLNEEAAASGQVITGCTIIPIEIALLSPMEENY